MEKVWPPNGIITVMALGVYISVPFCRTKCSYCNFASDVFSKTLFDRYVARICSDIENAERTASQMGGIFEPVVNSIYLGGGTPTVLEPAQLKRVFEALRRKFEVSADAEVTVECAPGTLTPAILETLLAYGVNRVSLGVQSFVDQEAAAVGRLHKRTTVLQDIACLRAAGIASINIDLIAGLPHQTAASWEISLDETIAAEAPHVSVYMLEVDEESRLGRELIAGGTRYHAHFVPNDDATADFYLAASERLASSGIAQYEISNFARPAFESRHNLKYWTRQPYLGFGVDAHSMLPADRRQTRPVDHERGDRRERGRDCREGEHGREGHGFSRADQPPKREPGFSPRGEEIEAVRFSTAESLERYIVDSPSQPTPISRLTALEENFFLGLRLIQGVNLRQLATEFGHQPIDNFREIIAEFVESGLLARDADLIRLTPRGRLLSNEVFQSFISTTAPVS